MTSDTGSIRVLSTLAVMGAMRAVTRVYQAMHGTVIEADFSPTVAGPLSALRC